MAFSSPPRKSSSALWGLPPSQFADVRESVFILRSIDNLSAVFFSFFSRQDPNCIFRMSHPSASSSSSSFSVDDDEPALVGSSTVPAKEEEITNETNCRRETADDEPRSQDVVVSSTTSVTSVAAGAEATFGHRDDRSSKDYVDDPPRVRLGSAHEKQEAAPATGTSSTTGSTIHVQTAEVNNRVDDDAQTGCPYPDGSGVRQKAASSSNQPPTAVMARNDEVIATRADEAPSSTVQDGATTSETVASTKSHRRDEGQQQMATTTAAAAADGDVATAAVRGHGSVTITSDTADTGKPMHRHHDPPSDRRRRKLDHHRGTGGGGSGGSVGGSRLIAPASVPRSATHLVDLYVKKPLTDEHESVMGANNSRGGGGPSAHPVAQAPSQLSDGLSPNGGGTAERQKGTNAEGESAGGGGSSHVFMFVPVASAYSASPRGVTEYDSSVDPFMKRYWDRKVALPSLWQERQKKLELAQRSSTTGDPTTRLRSHRKGMGRRALLTPQLSKSSQQTADSDVSESPSRYARAVSTDATTATNSVISPVHPHSQTVTPSPSPSSAGGHSSTATAGPQFHQAAVLSDAVSEREVRALRTMLCPTANWVCNLTTPNCDLSWMRHAIETRDRLPFALREGIPPPPAAASPAANEGSSSPQSVVAHGSPEEDLAAHHGGAGNGTTSDSPGPRTDKEAEMEDVDDHDPWRAEKLRFIAWKSTKTLLTMNYALLSHDALHHDLNNGDAVGATTLINSPRSTLLLLRNGLQAYDLLKRPANYYVKVGDEMLSRETEKARYRRIDDDRQAVVSRLQAEYVGLCAAFPTSVLLDVLLPARVTDASVAAIAAQRKRAKETFESNQRKLRGFAEVEAQRRHKASDKAVQLATLLHSRSEKKRQELEDRAKAMADKYEQKKRTQQMLTEVLIEEAEAQRRRIDEKHEQVDVKVKTLRHQRKLSGAQLREANEAKLETAKRSVDERDAELLRRRQEADALNQQRAEEFRTRVAREREESAALSQQVQAQQLKSKRRAVDHAERTRRMIQDRLEATEQRLEAFRQKQEEEAAIHGVLQTRKSETIRRAVEAAAIMEDERARSILAKMASEESRRNAVLAKQREEAEAEHEWVAGQRDVTRKIVSTVQKRQAFDKLCDLAELQQRESEVAALERAKRDTHKATGDTRLKLQILHHELAEKGVAHQIQLDRKQASEIYSIEHPIPRYRTPTRYRSVSPRIDAGQLSKQHVTATSVATVRPPTSSSPTKEPSATANVPPPRVSEKPTATGANGKEEPPPRSQTTTAAPAATPLEAAAPGKPPSSTTASSPVPAAAAPSPAPTVGALPTAKSTSSPQRRRVPTSTKDETAKGAAIGAGNTGDVAASRSLAPDRRRRSPQRSLPVNPATDTTTVPSREGHKTLSNQRSSNGIGSIAKSPPPVQHAVVTPSKGITQPQQQKTTSHAEPPPSADVVGDSTAAMQSGGVPRTMETPTQPSEPSELPTSPISDDRPRADQNVSASPVAGQEPSSVVPAVGPRATGTMMVNSPKKKTTEKKTVDEALHDGSDYSSDSSSSSTSSRSSSSPAAASSPGPRATTGGIRRDDEPEGEDNGYDSDDFTDESSPSASPQKAGRGRR